jgi:hypothetical protein
MLAFVAFSLAILLQNDLIATPIGRVPRKCVHHVPSGAEIVDDESGTMVHFQGVSTQITPCGINYRNVAPSFSSNYDGWLAYTSWEYSAGIDVFTGYFSVPNNPKQVPEVLYIFTGLQNLNWIPLIDPSSSSMGQNFDIIQPVLQYPGDSGNYWSVKNWYVTVVGDVLVSSEIRTVAGDNIFGNMTRTGAESYYIAGTSQKSGKTSSLSVTRSRLSIQPWAYNVLECYGCENCNYEPTQPTQFTQLELYAGTTQLTPQWTTAVSPNPRCHEQATVNGPSSVTIEFNA